MKSFGLSAISEFLGSHVVYRNLVPQDARLPSLADLRTSLDLEAGSVPRKCEQAYARVISRILTAAQDLRLPNAPIRRLVYIGDTQLNDGTAFGNICKAGRWSGMAFIGADRQCPAEVRITQLDGNELFLSNRWAFIEEFEKYCRQHAFAINDQTAVIVDLDKTALGARGRNDHVIDEARIEAARRTVSDHLGEEFDPEAFRTSYNTLNQPEFHLFTADNQDYLAYICLVLAGGLVSLTATIDSVRTGTLKDFREFIRSLDKRSGEMQPGLLNIHRDVYMRVQEGDPTPFKAFRWNEYLTTVERLGRCSGPANVHRLLNEEIVITSEVEQAALRWKAEGALLFGLSDKPDEASIPSPVLAQRGFRPIHQTLTHSVGGERGIQQLA
jgi:hypothetical protein